MACLVTGGKKLALTTLYGPAEKGNLSRGGQAPASASGRIQNRFKAVLCRVKPRSLSGCLILKVLPNLEFLNLEFLNLEWTIPRVHRRIVTSSLATSR